MTDSISNMRLKFYETIKELKQQLVILLQDDALDLTHVQRTANIKKLENIFAKLMLIKSTNSVLPIKLFHNSVMKPYGIYILTRNEDFFLNQNNLIDQIDEDQFDVFIDEIRNIWKLLDQSNKKVIWKYIILLCVICDKVVDEGLLDQIKKSI